MSDNSEAIILLILELIESGISGKDACAQYGVGYTDFVRAADPELLKLARERGADAQFDEYHDLENECRCGDLDPNVFKAISSSRQWRLARLKPKTYMDRHVVDNVSSDGTMSPKPAIDLGKRSIDELLELADKVNGPSSK